jgi:hypothetical protein
MGFETVRLAQIKTWLDGPQARAYEGAYGADEDEALLDRTAAVKLRWPLPDCIDASDDLALYHAGEHRRIERAPDEPGALYRGRLERAPLFWYWAGTAAGLMLVFEPFFPATFTPPTEELRHLDPVRDATMIAIQRSKGRVDPHLWTAATPPASTSIFVHDLATLGGPYWANGDAAHPWWSKVIVFLDSRSGPWTTDGTFADAGTFGDPGLIGSTITEFDLAYMQSMMRRVKAPSSYPFYVAVILEGDGTIGFLPDGLETFGDDNGVFGDVTQVSFLRIGHCDGEGVLYGVSPDGTFNDDLGGFVSFEDTLQR